MPGYDGEVRINTKIDNSGLSKGLSMSAREIGKLTDTFNAQSESIIKQTKNIQSLEKQLQELSKTKPSEAVSEMEKEQRKLESSIKRQKQSVNDLIAKRKALLEVERQGRTGGADWQAESKREEALTQIEKIEQRIVDKRERIVELEKDSADLANKISKEKVLSPEAVVESEKLNQQIKEAKDGLESSKKAANETASEIKRLSSFQQESARNSEKAADSLSEIKLNAKEAADSSEPIAHNLDAANAKSEKLTANFQKQTESIKKQSASVDEMRRKLEAIEAGEKAPASLVAMETQFKRINAEIDQQKAKFGDLERQYEEAVRLLEEQKEIGFAGEQLDPAIANVDRLAQELYPMDEALKSTTASADALAQKIQEVKLDPGTSAEAQTLRDKISLAEEKLESSKNKANELRDSLRDAFVADPGPMANTAKKIGDNAGKAATNIKKMGRETRNSGTQAHKAASGFEKLANRIGRLIIAVAVFNVIRRALTQLRDYMGKLLQSNTEFMASWNAVKVNLLAAFAPIWEIIQPALVSFMNVLASVTRMLATFIAMLFGKTYQQAKDSAKAINDQAKAIDKAGGAAKKASKQLYGFDEVNQHIEDSAGGAGDAAAGLDFEDIGAPDVSWLDPFLSALKKIADIFMSGFWKGFEGADFSKVTDALDSIWNSLREIFTDPAVVEAFTRMIASWTYNLGRIVGSIANIGVSIATMLLGGIARFLEDNTDSIKQYLIDMFNISAEISNIVGNWWVAIADIFTVLAGENAQEMVSAVIGIFYEIGRGINLIAARIGRDFLDLISGPVIENKDKIKIALDDIYGFFASILGDIKKLVQYNVDSIVKLYDSSIKPFIDNVKKAFTEWYGHILDGWNKYVQPVLDDFASKFTEVIEQHIKPMVDKAISYFGKLFEYLSVVWDKVLRPLVSWMIDTFSPLFASALENVGDVFLKIVGIISDSIGNIFDILSGLADFVIGVFTGNWQRAWDGLGNIVKGVINGMIGGINGFLTAIETMVNGISGAINAVGSLLGLPSISKISIPRVPKLAKGLDYVPYDNFPAILHKGERVLTADENAAYSANAISPAMLDAIDNFSISPAITNSIVEKGARQGNQELSDGTIAKLLNGIGETIAVSLASINTHGSADGSQQQPVGIYINGRKVGEAIYDDLADVGKGRGIPFATA